MLLFFIKHVKLSIENINKSQKPVYISLIASKTSQLISIGLRSSMKNTSKDPSSLLHRIATDDSYAFGQLFDMYQDVIYSFSLRLSRSETIAEEMVQEVFLKLWIKRKVLIEVENFDAYLNTMVRNVVYNTLRSLAVKSAFSEQLQPLHENTYCQEETYDKVAFQKLLDRAMELLTAQQHRVFTLCFFENQKYSDAAKILKISPGTVHSHMKSALKTVREHLSRNIDLISAILIIPLNQFT